jgi:phosphoglycolate phosphatase-like HAD superfamily hydrolase
MIGVANPDLQPSQGYGGDNTISPTKQLTLFCDFDGPIVDVSNRYYSTYKLALADTKAICQDRGLILPIQEMNKEQFWHMKQNRVADVEIAMRSGLQGEAINFFLGRVIEIVNDSELLRQDRLQPGVSWALALLHSQGFKLVLVTLRCQSQATQILRNYGLTRLFSGIYGTGDSDAAYQNNADGKTQLLEVAIAEQSHFPEGQTSAWMVGDTEADLLAAQALSIPSIALTCGIRSQLYLKQFQPNHIFSDLLTAAHYLLKRIKDVS